MNNIIKFQDWHPKIYRVPITEYAETVEYAMLTNQYGIYISYGEGVHAYHGNQPIDYDLCKQMGVEVVELKYNGGTIIGSADDLSIIIVFPREIDMTHEIIISKITEIIGKYIPNTTYDGNDILVDGEKISGSMTRTICNSFVWAAQITFGDYTEYIKKICQKPAIKTPTHITSTILTRDLLEKEILAWLTKQPLDESL